MKNLNILFQQELIRDKREKQLKTINLYDLREQAKITKMVNYYYFQEQIFRTKRRDLRVFSKTELHYFSIIHLVKFRDYLNTNNERLLKKRLKEIAKYKLFKEWGAIRIHKFFKRYNLLSYWRPLNPKIRQDKGLIWFREDLVNEIWKVMHK